MRDATCLERRAARGARDDHAHPGHARKTAALLQSCGNPVHLHENTEGGHGGSATNEQLAYRTALSYTHLWRAVGRRPADVLTRGACGDAVRYSGDEDRVRQILLNLLTNAIKLTRPGGSVVIVPASASRRTSSCASSSRSYRRSPATRAARAEQASG